jgi:hypothetical protein
MPAKTRPASEPLNNLINNLSENSVVSDGLKR